MCIRDRSYQVLYYYGQNWTFVVCDMFEGCVHCTRLVLQVHYGRSGWKSNIKTSFLKLFYVWVQPLWVVGCQNIQVGLGGVFRMETGTAKAHVNPDMEVGRSDILLG